MQQMHERGGHGSTGCATPTEGQLSTLASACDLPDHCTFPTEAGPAKLVMHLTSCGVLDTRYGYYWKTSEAEKNLLRTHTTAVSSRMLYRLAQTQRGGFKPAKYFSIDRVFRNEAIDRTHLAEFHQIEGASL